MIRRILAAAALLLAGPALAQTVTVDQAKAAAATATSFVATNHLYDCDPTQPDGFNGAWYATQRPDVVKLWGGSLLSHYLANGKREGTAPCKPTSVTQAQALASVSTVSAYLAQPALVATASATVTATNPKWARGNDVDGLNADYYNAMHPDVPAAGMSAHDNYVQYGRFTGALPYEGAAPHVVVARDYLFLPRISARIPDVWLPAGATEARVQFFSEHVGRPNPRSYDVDAIAGSSTSTLNWEVGGRTQHIRFLPSTGSRAEWVIALDGKSNGHFTVSLAGNDSFMLLGSATVHIGETPPAGVTLGNPAPLPVLTPTSPPLALIATKPAFYTDFHDLSGISTGGWSLNNMNGWFVRTGIDNTVSGKTVDVMPWVMEGGRSFRRLRVLDQRNDLIYVADRKIYARFGTAALSLPIGGATGVWLTDLRLPHMLQDDAGWWGVRQDGAWPPEWDWFETLGRVNAECTTAHNVPGNTTQGSCVTSTALTNGWHVRIVQRTDAAHEPAMKIGMYRQWTCTEQLTACTLIAEMPDFNEGEPNGTVHSLEALGGAGGDGTEPAPGADMSGHQMDLDHDAYWPLAA